MTAERYQYDYTDVMLWGGIMLIVIWLFAKAPLLDWLTLAVYTGAVILLIILAIQITRIQRNLDELIDVLEPKKAGSSQKIG